MDRLGLTRVDLVGFSIGGWIAAEIATKVPERLERLVLIGPVGVKTGTPDKLDIPDVFAMPQDKLDRAAVPRSRERTRSTSATMSDEELHIVARNSETLALLAWEPYMHNPKLKHRLHRVTVPTLFLRGASDGIVSAEYLARYAALVPKARIETIAEAGHLPQVEQPEATPRRSWISCKADEGRPRHPEQAMKAWHFSENAYPYLPPADEYESIRVSLPNRIYDPEKGAALYDRYIDEWLIAEDEGMEIMLNEHHQTATCVDPAAPLVLAALARLTKKARLLILGNPVANRRQPVRVAEEMAMVDMLSKGRLECGFVRGVPYEVLPANSNPVRMNERQWEAMDLIVKAWTSHDGPFSHEGRFFHHRNINIWPRPYQQPHPPIWVSHHHAGRRRRASARAAMCRRPSSPASSGTPAIYDAYRKGWREAGRGSDVPINRLAYAALVYTGESEAEARAGAEKLLWYMTANKVPLHFCYPPGYVPTAGACADPARRGHRPARREPGERDRGQGDRGRHHVRRHARPGLSADQEDLRPRRRLRPSADHGPGRLPRTRRDRARDQDLRARGLSAAQGSVSRHRDLGRAPGGEDAWWRSDVCAQRAGSALSCC